MNWGCLSKEHLNLPLRNNRLWKPQWKQQQGPKTRPADSLRLLQTGAFLQGLLQASAQPRLKWSTLRGNPGSQLTILISREKLARYRLTPGFILTGGERKTRSRELLVGKAEVQDILLGRWTGTRLTLWIKDWKLRGNRRNGRLRRPSKRPTTTNKKATVSLPTNTQPNTHLPSSPLTIQALPTFPWAMQARPLSRKSTGTRIGKEEIDLQSGLQELWEFLKVAGLLFPSLLQARRRRVRVRLRVDRKRIIRIRILLIRERSQLKARDWLSKREWTTVPRPLPKQLVLVQASTPVPREKRIRECRSLLTKGRIWRRCREEKRLRTEYRWKYTTRILKKIENRTKALHYVKECLLHDTSPKNQWPRRTGQAQSTTWTPHPTLEAHNNTSTNSNSNNNKELNLQGLSRTITSRGSSMRYRRGWPPGI